LEVVIDFIEQITPSEYENALSINDGAYILKGVRLSLMQTT